MMQAEAYATARFIDALAKKTASFALDAKTKATVEITEGKDVNGKCSSEALELASDILESFGYSYGLDIKTESCIPSGAGLGEKEAEYAAVALAVTGELSRRHGAVNELKIDKYVRDQFVVLDEKVVDKKKLVNACAKYGDFDRVFASFFGGFAIADNRRKTVMRRGEMETMHYVAVTPEKRESAPERIRFYRNELEIIYEEARKGNLYSAMKLGSLLYSEREDGISEKMFSAGALATLVSYPSVVALTRDSDKVAGIEEAVKGEGIVLKGMPSNEAARILDKPRRIVKAREFVEMKGEQEYYFL